MDSSSVHFSAGGSSNALSGENLNEINENLTTSSMCIHQDQEIDQNQLVSYQSNIETIQNIYSHFSENNKSLERLNDCIEARNNLEGIYRQLYTVNRVEAEKLKVDLDKANEIIQEMNAHSPTLTGQDAKALLSFFEAPIEEFFVDKEHGVKYFQPDHSQLLGFGEQFFMSGGYSAIGLLRERNIQNVVCDILYLTKQPDQIEYEAKKTSWFGGLSKEEKLNVQKRIEVQEQLYAKASKEIAILTDQCKYASFMFCGKEELKKLGFSEEGSIKNHALLFFYKQTQ